MHGIDRLPVNARTFWHRFYASPVPPLHSKYLTYRQTTTGIEGQVPPGATKWWVRQILFRCFQRYPDHVLATSAKGEVMQSLRFFRMPLLHLGLAQALIKD